MPSRISRTYGVDEYKNFLRNNPPPSVQGLRRTGMDADDAIDYILEERKKLRKFDDQCDDWIQEAEATGACRIRTLGYQLRCNYEVCCFRFRLDRRPATLLTLIGGLTILLPRQYRTTGLRHAS